MNFSRIAVTTALVGGAFFAGGWAQKNGALLMSNTEYLKLSEPLLLSVEGIDRNFHILPAGTPLYKDQAFAEGHSRYIVYVNIKGEFAAEPITSDKKNLIDPIWAYTVPKDDVTELLAETPISKDELSRILKARRMTREDLAQILREWKE
jgi:hypothetical protein